MRWAIAAAVVLLFWTSPAYAYQNLIGGTGNNLSNTAEAFGPLGMITSTANIDNNSFSTAPFGGLIGRLTVSLNVAPGAGASRSFFLRKNLATTTAACTISGTATTCTDWADTISYAPGDVLTWVTQPSSGTAPASSFAFISTVSWPNTPGDMMLLSRAATPSNTVENFENPLQNVAWNALESASTMLLPIAGKLDSLFYKGTGTLGGAGKMFVFTVRDNIASTSVSCTANNTATCSDTTDAVSVQSGDLADIAELPVSTPSAVTTGFGLRYRAPGSSMAFSSNANGTTDSASIENFLVVSGLSSPRSSESNATAIVPAQMWVGTLIASTTAPGIGKSRIFTVRKNSADTPLSCTIIGNQTSCTATGSVKFEAGDLIDVGDTPVNNPAIGAPLVALAAGDQHGVLQIKGALSIKGALIVQ